MFLKDQYIENQHYIYHNISIYSSNANPRESI